jgi:hypothetical protein
VVNAGIVGVGKSRGEEKGKEKQRLVHCRWLRV